MNVRLGAAAGAALAVIGLVVALATAAGTARGGGGGEVGLGGLILARADAAGDTLSVAVAPGGAVLLVVLPLVGALLGLAAGRRRHGAS